VDCWLCQTSGILSFPLQADLWNFLLKLPASAQPAFQSFADRITRLICGLDDQDLSDGSGCPECNGTGWICHKDPENPVICNTRGCPDEVQDFCKDAKLCIFCGGLGIIRNPLVYDILSWWDRQDGDVVLAVYPDFMQLAERLMPWLHREHRAKDRCKYRNIDQCTRIRMRCDQEDYALCEDVPPEICDVLEPDGYACRSCVNQSWCYGGESTRDPLGELCLDYREKGPHLATLGDVLNSNYPERLQIVAEEEEVAGCRKQVHQCIPYERITEEGRRAWKEVLAAHVIEYDSELGICRLAVDPDRLAAFRSAVEAYLLRGRYMNWFQQEAKK
jgi:hypothetical protein